MAKKLFTVQRIREGARAFFDESVMRAEGEASRLHRFVHFWMLVGRSFSRNRCPVRASALAYATLLALIPMLAVVVSITSTFLKKEGEERIDQFIVKVVASVTPPDALNTNLVTAATNAPAAAGAALSNTPSRITESGAAGSTNEAVMSSGGEGGGQTAVSAFEEGQKAVAARKAIARDINRFIQNTRSGALGVTGSVLLIFAGISLLSRIEDTFNDIWGVVRGRSWFMRVVLYWGVLTLAPLLLIVALGLATGPHLEATRRLVERMPYVGSVLFDFGFQVLPVVLLCVTFALIYMLMPNARVRWEAALVGGLAGGLLFHLNNLVSVLYVSRVVSNSRVYGSLGLVPVFMIGLYLSWLILLFGAQVAYAFQNRTTYLEEKQIENVNQRGREFVALRLMTCIGQHFSRGEAPPAATDMCVELSVPTRLIRQVMQPLIAARLAIETAESAYLPARPLESITCHDILFAMRASQGQELATRDEPARAEVYGEFQRIQEAERQAASSVTVLALVNRAGKQITG